MSHRIVNKFLPVVTAVTAGLAVFFIFGGMETHESTGRYACPMLCVVLENPGNCPVCGMELEQLVETGDTLLVSDVGLALAGLSSVEVAEKQLSTVRRFPAKVVFNRETVVDATSWVDGRITDVRITGPGESVERSQILAVLHSPQLLSARTDYISAVGSGDPFLKEAAEDRLLELGVQPGSFSEPSAVAYIRSPVSGRIGEMFLNSGAWLSRGTAFATVIEEDGREIRIDVPGSMALRMEAGLQVSFTYAGESWSTSVKRVNAELDRQTLTLPVFSELPDQLALPAGSYLMVEIRFPDLETLIAAVPERAVLRLGERSIVYVDLGEGRYLPRVVRTGELAYDDNFEPYFPVLEGLSAGDIVVLDAAFLLDSQAELTGITSLLNSSTGEDL